ncbi:unnamed protein product [Didymodactylos carnosus]|uniref:Uncharacterized protein n=1 Tax=Didymodactylos carnosus TaxID=1234261 RepID=A0A813ZXM2_9BILA|nr:unnamed protein product [Didymodactylos carnosus]CAF1250165.1 unnamed protein product [Didymodactylos carnosus]CAF3688309.1 unnamed protein product [Didymodactylos carnosus]CAF4057693.1 unnamed protein product [Didymodactylos carnosus]
MSDTPTPQIIDPHSIIVKKSSTSEIEIFRKPLPPSLRRQKRKTLDEEKYVQDLSHIIERDFFPNIEKLKAQEKYLTALATNDVVTLRELQLKYSIYRGPSPSPTMGAKDTPSNSFETPLEKMRDTPKTRKDEHSKQHMIEEEEDECNDDDNGDNASTTTTKKKRARDLTLDNYLNLNTSEDNISFEQLMDEKEKRERAKLHQAWLFEQQHLRKMEQETQLALPSVEQQAITNNPGTIVTWPYTAKNAVMYYPEGCELTSAEKIEHAKRVRSIQHHNTRFVQDPFAITDSTSKITTSRKQAIQIDIDGSEIKSTETPKVNGYGFVVTPSPMPGQHGDESPVMTWGQIEGTPFCLDGDTSQVLGPSFKINTTPLREQLAMELVEKASQQHRKRKLEAIKTINKNFSTTSKQQQQTKQELVSNMSPAAQRLLTLRLGVNRTNSSSVNNRSNMFTPSPIHRTFHGNSPRTPSSLGIIKHQQSSPSTQGLTDNLLNLRR